MGLFGGGNKAKSSTADKLGSIAIQSQGYGNVVPIVLGKVRVPVTLFFYGNFRATPVQQQAQQGGKGGQKSRGNTTYNYSAALMMGIASHVIQGTGKLWVDKKKYNAISDVGFSLFTGSSAQSPWGYLTTYEPTKAVNLRGHAYLAVNNYPLSDNATIGNHTVEVLGLFCNNVTNDANPADFIPWLLINECNIPTERIADVTTFRVDCDANDWLFSVALTEQKSTGEFIKEILNLCDTELVIKEGYWHFINYKDAGLVTGINLSSDDFIIEQGEAPIKPTRKKAVDCFNALKLEFINRANDYNIETAEAKDAASIASIGLRTAETLTAHCICRADQARTIVEHLLQRDLVIRNQYEFTLSIRYIRLEPMDVVTITDSVLGLFGQAVAIKKIVLTPDFKLKITAEDSIFQVHEYVSYPAPITEPYIPDHTAAVGNINPPVIFLAPAERTVSGYEVWCAISNSDALYGGCEIHLSIDGGVSYTRIGIHAGQSRMGVLTLDLPASSDPDDNNTLSVDLTESNAVLNDVTQLSVDSLETLSRVNNEFLAYRDTTLTAPAHYNLQYLRRGLYGSTQGANAGDSFVRCDDTLFRFAYNPIYIGTTFKLKFVSYNIYENGLQDISTVPAYDFTITPLRWNDGVHRWNDGSRWE